MRQMPGSEGCLPIRQGTVGYRYQERIFNCNECDHGINDGSERLFTGGAHPRLALLTLNTLLGSVQSYCRRIAVVSVRVPSLLLLPQGCTMHQRASSGTAARDLD